MKKVAVIGGGAAGLAFAIMLKRIDASNSVTVFEALDRVGKKLALTGNGRCNITNLNLDKSRYHGDPLLAEKLINNFGFKKQEDFFKTLGVLFTHPEDDRVYPKSLQAASVTDALRFAATDENVEIFTNAKVESVTRNGQAFTVSANQKNYTFDAVVVATGGCAGGKIASWDGYEILKRFGHKIEALMPSIVQLKTAPDTVRQLKGIKVNATVTLKSSAGERSDFGEVLFCDYGLSGPAVLQVSRLSQGQNAVISLDLLPDMTDDEVLDEILFRTNNFKSRPVTELFAGFLNKKLSHVVMKSCGINLGENCSDINEKQLKTLAHTLKKWDFKVTGDTGFANAQATAGGAQTTQFFDTLMSKKVKGLFAVGEVLNVDGDCGGFNLAFAWASAYAAANGVAEYLKDM